MHYADHLPLPEQFGSAHYGLATFELETGLQV